MNRKLRSQCLGLLLGCGLFCQTASVVQADSVNDALVAELKAIAKGVHGVLEKKDFKVVAVGQFSASANISGSAGPEIQTKLSKELEALNVIVRRDDTQAEVQGNYLPFVDPESKAQGVKLVARVIDSDGTNLGEFARFVFGQETVPRMLGLNVQTPPVDDPHQRSDAFKQALQKQKDAVPVPTIGPRISAEIGSPYAIEVHIKKGGKYVPSKPTPGDRGLPFCPIQQDEVYGVMLINDSDFEAAVNLTIDGLSCFHFSETVPQPKFWIVPKRGRLMIDGWHKNEKKFMEFKVTDFPQSAAASVNLKPSETIGMVSAAFSACWENDAQRPPDEKLTPSRGTGFGSEIDRPNERVKRTVGNVRSCVSVRYER